MGEQRIIVSVKPPVADSFIEIMGFIDTFGEKPN